MQQLLTSPKKYMRKFLQPLFFLLLMLLTFHTVLRQSSLTAIFTAVTALHPLYLCLAVLCALFYVCAEGFMIWWLLRLTRQSVRLLRCFVYSFIGFFFSGVTPSATGGQPAQLVAMKKDGVSLGDATLTLMTVALLYKFVLVLIGAALLCFRRDGIHACFGQYTVLYYVGLSLNVLLVALLLLMIFHGEWMHKLLLLTEKTALRFRLCKPSEKRKDAFCRMVADYQSALHFFLAHKYDLLFVTVCTFLQRCSLFLLTYLIYRGMGLSGSSAWNILSLQAAIYIAVDMLPLPGSQGISELIYHTVFSTVFTGGSLAASMCITRGISFYFLLILSAIIAFLNYRFRTTQPSAASYFHSK